MLAVITLGIEGGTFVAEAAGEPGAGPQSAATAAGDLESLAATVSEALEVSDAVLAVYPAWHAEPALQQLQTIRSMLEAPRVLSFGTSLPPLAAATLAGLAAAMGGRGISPGVLIGGLRRIESELVVFAWAGSVARLRHPAPTLGQHVRSYRPRSSFFVSVQPEAAVVPLGRQVGPLLELAPSHHVVVAGPRIDDRWLHAAAATVRRSADTVLDAQPLVPQWWGTAKVVEGVAFPRDIDALAARVRRAASASCPWCGEDTVAPPCPFCGMAGDEAGAQAGGQADGEAEGEPRARLRRPTRR
jgi:hypothetical protein